MISSLRTVAGDGDRDGDGGDTNTFTTGRTDASIRVISADAPPGDWKDIEIRTRPLTAPAPTPTPTPTPSRDSKVAPPAPQKKTAASIETDDDIPKSVFASNIKTRAAATVAMLNTSIETDDDEMMWDVMMQVSLENSIMGGATNKMYLPMRAASSIVVSAFQSKFAHELTDKAIRDRALKITADISKTVMNQDRAGLDDIGSRDYQKLCCLVKLDFSDAKYMMLCQVTDALESGIDLLDAMESDMTK
jgi:hypothetical protein